MLNRLIRKRNETTAEIEAVEKELQELKVKFEILEELIDDILDEQKEEITQEV